VNTVINLRFPWNAGNFLTSWGPGSFSRRTLLHGVSLYTCIVTHTYLRSFIHTYCTHVMHILPCSKICMVYFCTFVCVLFELDFVVRRTRVIPRLLLDKGLIIHTCIFIYTICIRLKVFNTCVCLPCCDIFVIISCWSYYIVCTFNHSPL
jgi:hypothetical protein